MMLLRTPIKNKTLHPNFLLSFSTSKFSTPEVERIARIINDHPFPDQPLKPVLSKHLPLASLSAELVESVLGRLFAAHANGLKALEFFKYSQSNALLAPTPGSFEKTLHILARMRYFDEAWVLMAETRDRHPSLLTLKSMSILLCKIAKFQSFDETLEAFARMENEIFIGREFGTGEFNVLLRAFCTEREMKEARSVFQKMHSRYKPDTKTMNILLSGFKESGDITAMELFYHEMVRRGFKPNAATYSVRIDAYCKKRSFGDALSLFEEMGRVGCPPSLATVTTLTHGAGVARNAIKARQMFDEIPRRRLKPDTGAYNALISALIRCKDISAAIELMEEMKEKGIGHDDMTYHTMFLGLMKLRGFEGVLELYSCMIKNKFMPKTRTVVMLMKFFCERGHVDMGLDLWGYMLEKGHCPHGHALELLATGLCSRGRVREAFECSKQLLERGRHMSTAAYLMVERCLVECGEMERLNEIKRLVLKLQSVLPPSRGHITSKPTATHDT